MECLKTNKDTHHHCQDFSKDYLQCRMDHDLMAKESMNSLGFAGKVKDAKEYDLRKEKEGFTAGKHISKESKWWWQSS